MDKRTLLIATRQGTKEEFCNYWMGKEEPIYFDPPNTSHLTEPILIERDNFLVLIFNGRDMPDESSDVAEVVELLFHFSKSLDIKIIAHSEIGVIWHGYDPLPNISGLIPESSTIIFNRRYSSSLRGNFCEQRNGDFYSNTDPTQTRDGVMDAFRDVVTLSAQRDGIEQQFAQLWDYFEGKILIQSLISLKKIVNRRKLCADDISRNWLEKQKTNSKLEPAIKKLLLESEFPANHEQLFLWIDHQLNQYEI